MPYENVTIYVVWENIKEETSITVDTPVEDIKVPDTFVGKNLLVIITILSLLFISIKITKKTS